MRRSVVLEGSQKELQINPDKVREYLYKKLEWISLQIIKIARNPASSNAVLKLRKLNQDQKDVLDIMENSNQKEVIEYLLSEENPPIPFERGVFKISGIDVSAATADVFLYLEKRLELLKSEGLEENEGEIDGLLYLLSLNHDVGSSYKRDVKLYLEDLLRKINFQSEKIAEKQEEIHKEIKSTAKALEFAGLSSLQEVCDFRQKYAFLDDLLVKPKIINNIDLRRGITTLGNALELLDLSGGLEKLNITPCGKIIGRDIIASIAEFTPENLLHLLSWLNRFGVNKESLNFNEEEVKQIRDKFKHHKEDFALLDDLGFVQSSVTDVVGDVGLEMLPELGPSMPGEGQVDNLQDNAITFKDIFVSISGDLDLIFNLGKIPGYLDGISRRVVANQEGHVASKSAIEFAEIIIANAISLKDHDNLILIFRKLQYLGCTKRDLDLSECEDKDKIMVLLSKIKDPLKRQEFLELFRHFGYVDKMVLPQVISNKKRRGGGASGKGIVDPGVYQDLPKISDAQRIAQLEIINAKLVEDEKRRQEVAVRREEAPVVDLLSESSLVKREVHESPVLSVGLEKAIKERRGHRKKVKEKKDIPHVESLEETEEWRLAQKEAIDAAAFREAVIRKDFSKASDLLKTYKDDCSWLSRFCSICNLNIKADSMPLMSKLANAELGAPVSIDIDIFSYCCHESPSLALQMIEKGFVVNKENFQYGFAIAISSILYYGYELRLDLVFAITAQLKKEDIDKISNKTSEVGRVIALDLQEIIKKITAEISAEPSNLEQLRHFYDQLLFICEKLRIDPHPDISKQKALLEKVTYLTECGPTLTEDVILDMFHSYAFDDMGDLDKEAPSGEDLIINANKFKNFFKERYPNFRLGDYKIFNHEEDGAREIDLTKDDEIIFLTKPISLEKQVLLARSGAVSKSRVAVIDLTEEEKADRKSFYIKVLTSDLLAHEILDKYEDGACRWLTDFGNATKVKQDSGESLTFFAHCCNNNISIARLMLKKGFEPEGSSISFVSAIAETLGSSPEAPRGAALKFQMTTRH
jgi:hypothetical protein